MLPGRWGIGVGVGIRKSIIGRLNGTGRDSKPKEHSAAALWKPFRVPGAELLCGSTGEQGSHIPHVVFGLEPKVNEE